ncbi:unnamed protein product [Ascophyllum nodosum]
MNAALPKTTTLPVTSLESQIHLTTVTLKIVGGQQEGGSFTALQHAGKTPSETVAQSIVFQMASENSELLRGGLTHTAISASWCPAGRRRKIDSWEGYWCHCISPIFFGRSVRSRRVTKVEARRSKETEHNILLQPDVEPNAARVADVYGKDVASCSEGASEPRGGIAHHRLLGVKKEDHQIERITGLPKPRRVTTPDSHTASPPRPKFLVGLEDQLVAAEIHLQKLLAEGLADGGRLSVQQYRALKIRNRAIKKVLLRRKIEAKRRGGGGTIRKPFPCRKIAPEEIRSWEVEIAQDDRVRSAERRAQKEVERQERRKDARKRENRNQIKSWLIRQLMASNGNAELTTKSFALQDKEDNLAAGTITAAFDAPGRESSLSGKHLRSGRSFAYGQETTTEQIRRREMLIKKQMMFEVDTDALLRTSFRVAARSYFQACSSSVWSRSRFATSSWGAEKVTKQAGPRSRLLGGPVGDSGAVHKTCGNYETREKVAGGDNGNCDDDGGNNTPDRFTARIDTAWNPLDASVDSGPAPVSESTTGTAALNHSASPAGGSTGALHAPRISSGVGEDNRGGGGGRAEEKTASAHLPDDGPPVLIPKTSWLHVLRQPSEFQRKCMDSKAIRPILNDGNFTKAFLALPCLVDGAITEDELALFGSVVAEVDHWYKRVRATLDPVKAHAEAKVKLSASRKKRFQELKTEREQEPNEGLEPSGPRRQAIDVSRKSRRDLNSRHWSRSHHHVIIKVSQALPSYCCLCRQRKWDEARVRWLQEEHAFRNSWNCVLSEMQEILEPLVQSEVRTSLLEDKALRDMGAGAWAVQHCVEPLISTIPGRIDTLSAVGQAIDEILDRVVHASISVGERAYKRRMAALMKLRALGTFQGAAAGSSSTSPQRRRSRRVSVGPWRIEVTPDKNMARSTAVGVIQVTPGTDGSFPERSPQNEWSDLSSVVVSESRSSKIPIVDTAAAKADIKEAIAKSLAAVTGGVEGLAARDGEKRQFADFSEHVQATALTYYNTSPGFLRSIVRTVPSWNRLQLAWFRDQEYESGSVDEEKETFMEACVMEVLDIERKTLERQERERRGMFAEDESRRRDNEALRRAVEALPRKRQEVGHRAFCATVGAMERRAPSISRLRWELTVNLENTQDMTCRVRDAATRKRYMCRILPCRGQQEIDAVLLEAYRIQEVRNPSLVAVYSAHPHRITTYDESGVQTTGGLVVLLLTEFCSGGSLQGNLKLAVTQLGHGSTAGARGRRWKQKQSLFESDAYDEEVIEPKSRDIYTPEIQSMFLEDGEGKEQTEDRGTQGRDHETNIARDATGGARGQRRKNTFPKPHPATRLETWVRQVAHGLSALHASGGIHRNISAGSVYLDEKGRAKLGNYYCLKVPPRDSTGPFDLDEGFGCVATTPPEFELRGEISPKGDVWSLGCALFKWTTGKEFSCVAAGARLQDTLELVAPSWGSKIKMALFMCLQHEPEARVSSLELWKFMAATGRDIASPPPRSTVAQ